FVGGDRTGDAEHVRFLIHSSPLRYAQETFAGFRFWIDWHGKENISSSRAKSRDPEEVTFKFSGRDPSTSLRTTITGTGDSSFHCKINLRLRMRSAPMIWRNFCKSSSIDLLIMV